MPEIGGGKVDDSWSTEANDLAQAVAAGLFGARAFGERGGDAP